MENVFIKYEDNYSPGFLKFVGVMVGIIGGLILMMTGVILSIVSYFEQINFNFLEVILFIVSIVLLIIGAHTLDLIEREKEARRKSLCKEGAAIEELTEREFIK